MVNFGNISIADLRLGATQVKAAYLGDKQIWGGEEPAPVGNWLRFDILADDTSIDIVNDSGTLETPDLEYSVDDGATWTQWVPGSDFPHEMAGAVVYVRAGVTGNTRFADINNPNAYWHFTSDDLFSVSGNIMSLLSRDGSTGLSEYCFYRLFDGCTMLVDAGGLELPATTLAEFCYRGMFRGCTSLSAAPELPATTLAIGCYMDMLSACTSLTTAPALPATSLAESCYHQMFTGCTSLTAAPVLSAETLSGYCYYRMFSGCSSLSSMEVAFTDWKPQTATNNWLNNVAASGTFKCPTTLPDTRGASNIPVGWQVVNPTIAVEYIESDGTQYINTGINGNTVYGVEFSFMTPAGVEQTTAWANPLASVMDNFTLGFYDRNNSKYFLRWRTQEVFQANAQAGVKQTLEISRNTITFGDSSYAIATSQPVCTASGNIMICTNTALSRLAKVKIYGLKLYDSSFNLLRDLVPVRVGNVGYMYDNVSGELFGNDGTGAFIIGPDV